VAVLLAWTALIALWGTLSPSLRDSPSLADLDALAA
jgi:hypothetical protein